MRYCIAEHSSVGARLSNQDRLAHRATDAALLMVVADGMGGHPHGEVAAQAVVEHLVAEFERLAQPRLAQPGEFLLRALGGSHPAIMRRTVELGLPEAPRTTAVACVVQDDRVFWSHVGDSRLYLMRGGRVVARTRDHTRVQQLVDAGRVREEALALHPERNLLLQCLGGDRLPRLEPLAAAPLLAGDILLLCSDGLWGPLSPAQLVAGLRTAEPDLVGAVERLAALAEWRAGRECDNVSALAMVWQGEDLGRPLAAAEAAPKLGARRR